MWHCGLREAVGSNRHTHSYSWPGKGETHLGRRKKKEIQLLLSLYTKSFTRWSFLFPTPTYGVFFSAEQYHGRHPGEGIYQESIFQKPLPCYLSCLHWCCQEQTRRSHTQSRSDSVCTDPPGSWTHHSPCQSSGTARTFTWNQCLQAPLRSCQTQLRDTRPGLPNTLSPKRLLPVRNKCGTSAMIARTCNKPASPGNQQGPVKHWPGTASSRQETLLLLYLNSEQRPPKASRNRSSQLKLICGFPRWWGWRPPPARRP